MIGHPHPRLKFDGSDRIAGDANSVPELMVTTLGSSCQAGLVRRRRI